MPDAESKSIAGYPVLLHSEIQVHRRGMFEDISSRPMLESALRNPLSCRGPLSLPVIQCSEKGGAPCCSLLFPFPAGIAR